MEVYHYQLNFFLTTDNRQQFSVLYQAYAFKPSKAKTWAG